MADTNRFERFQGFADSEARFFQLLAKHQDRAWFQAHKPEYEEGWARPMQALLAELREKVAPYFRGRALAEPKVFRIFRDVRFSKDKSPYKTHIGGHLSFSAPTGCMLPAPLYLQVGTESFVAAGQYMMEPSQLDRFRRAILADRRGQALTRMLAGLKKRGYSPHAHELLKRVPRGLDPDHPRADLLKHKSLVVGFPEIPRELLTSRAFVGWLARGVKDVAPLVEWLAEATG
jgi:uncharacterized protein (TIGR02453 family)